MLEPVLGTVGHKQNQLHFVIFYFNILKNDIPIICSEFILGKLNLLHFNLSCLFVQTHWKLHLNPNPLPTPLLCITHFFTGRHALSDPKFRLRMLEYHIDIRVKKTSITGLHLLIFCIKFRLYECLSAVCQKTDKQRAAVCWDILCGSMWLSK